MKRLTGHRHANVGKPGALALRPAARAGAGVTVALVLALAWGCAGGNRKAELAGLLEAGQLPELVQRAESYVEHGERNPWIQYYLGLALLRQDQDRRAMPALRAAVAADSTMAPALAAELSKAAHADLTSGWETRGAARMALAYQFDRSVELGEWVEPVARDLYGEKLYAAALPLYRQLAQQGDGPAAKRQEWGFRAAYCLDRLGRTDEALDAYRGFLEAWPDPTTYRRRAMWRYQETLLDRAEALLATQPAAALPVIQEALAPGWNDELLQRGRVLAGSAMETLGRPTEALDWYMEVVRAAATVTAGATYVERARERIEALRAVRTN